MPHARAARLPAGPEADRGAHAIPGQWQAGENQFDLKRPEDLRKDEKPKEPAELPEPKFAEERAKEPGAAAGEAGVAGEVK